LRQHRKQDGLNTTGAGSPQRFQRLRIDILDRLGGEADRDGGDAGVAGAAPRAPAPSARVGKKPKR